MVRGCVELLRDGLGSAQAIDDATISYRSTQDLFGQFVADWCHVATGKVTRDCPIMVKAGQLLEEYNRWLELSGLDQRETQPGLAEILESKNYVWKRSNGIWWCGIALKPQDQRDEPGCGTNGNASGLSRMSNSDDDDIFKY